jgi:hypothetical protein
MPRRRQGQYRTVKAVSYETMALATGLTFPPPLADRSEHPEAFEFWWKLLKFVFDLSGPNTFPSLSVPPEGEDLEAVHRYRRAAEETAESAILATGRPRSHGFRERLHGRATMAPFSRSREDPSACVRSVSEG